MKPDTSQVVIVAYRPRIGREQDLLQLTREHIALLRTENLATDMPETLLQGEDGVIVEIFEWAAGGMAAAHHNPAVLMLWKRYFEASEVVPLKDLAEASELFASFTRLML